MGRYIFESVMLVCFGASWPFAIAKTFRARDAKGKSLVFMSLILLGYAAGIAHKIINPPAPGAPGLAAHVVWLYALNFALVAVDFALCVKYGAHNQR